MPEARIRAFLTERGAPAEIRQFADTHSAELAAEALGVDLAQISKSLVFTAGDQVVLVVVPGDRKVDPKLLKALLGAKPRMADAATVLEATGYSVGGVCPFALARPLRILLDNSLGRFETIWTAGGTADTLLPVSWSELPRLTGGELVDVTAPR